LTLGHNQSSLKSGKHWEKGGRVEGEERSTPKALEAFREFTYWGSFWGTVFGA